MNTLAEELLSTLGKSVSDGDVSRLIEQHGLDDVMDDPPSRRYIGSAQKGVDLLSEDEKVVEVQFHAEKTKSRSAFTGELPLGLKAGMLAGEVHKLLGKPTSADEFDSKYFLKKYNAQLTVVYGSDGGVKYVSIGV